MSRVIGIAAHLQKAQVVTNYLVGKGMAVVATKQVITPKEPAVKWQKVVVLVEMLLESHDKSSALI